MSCEKKLKELEEELEKVKSDLGICKARNEIVERKYLNECTDKEKLKKLKKENEELLSKNQELAIKLNNALDDNFQLKQEILKLKDEVKALNQNDERWEQMYNDLKAKYDKLKEKSIKASSPTKREIRLAKIVKALIEDNKELALKIALEEDLAVIPNPFQQVYQRDK